MKFISDESAYILRRIAAAEDAESLLSGDNPVSPDLIVYAVRETLPYLQKGLARQLRFVRNQAEHPRTHQPWSIDEEERLYRLRQQGRSFVQISTELGRNAHAVQRRYEQMAARRLDLGSRCD